MKTTIRWGILGCGIIADKFATSAAALEGVKIIAAASQTPGKAAAFAQKHGIGRHYDDYTDLLNNPDVDAVYIATTHNYHFAHASQVLAANKALLCEKPFTVNARELRTLITVAQEHRLFMMEAMWTRFLPALGQVRSWLQEGVLGEIKQIRATFGFQFPYQPDHRLYNLDLAGGALLDAGIYPLSFADMVMQQAPVEIKALGEIGPSGVDVQSSYNLKYTSGCLALLDATINAPVVSRAEIIGTQGRIKIPRDFLSAQEVWLELKGADPVYKHLPFAPENGFKFELAAASEAIRQGLLEHEIMPLRDSLRIMETIDIIKQQLGLSYGNDTVPATAEVK